MQNVWIWINLDIEYVRAETRKCEQSVWNPGFTFCYIDEVWIWKYKFEELKSFERRRENTRVSFSDNSALPIVIKFNLKKKLSLLKKNGK